MDVNLTLLTKSTNEHLPFDGFHVRIPDHPEAVGFYPKTIDKSKLGKFLIAFPQIVRMCYANGSANLNL